MAKKYVGLTAYQLWALRLVEESQTENGKGYYDLDGMDTATFNRLIKMGLLTVVYALTDSGREKLEQIETRPHKQGPNA